MKRILVILLTVVTTALTISAEKTVLDINSETVFTNAPDEIFPTLDSNTRMDMVDYYNCGYNRPSLNLFEDSAIITRKDSLGLEIKIGEKQYYQLSIPKDDLIVLVTTLSIPMQDSEIKFYDNEWQQLPNESFIVLPTLNDWLTDEGKTVRDDVENMYPFITAKYDFDVNKGELTITNTMQEYFDKDTWQRVLKWIKPSIQYKWTGSKFKKQ
ncbi:MAG: DUF3256 family protein [Muribaculaceae bacterium]|nr:DUF3256 family protein [Muribaculaceae bacterium]